MKLCFKSFLGIVRTFPKKIQSQLPAHFGLWPFFDRKMGIFFKKSENPLPESKSTSKCHVRHRFSLKKRFLTISRSYEVVFRVKSGNFFFRNFENHVFRLINEIKRTKTQYLHVCMAGIFFNTFFVPFRLKSGNFFFEISKITFSA